MKPFALLTFSIVAIVFVSLAIVLMLQFFPQEDVFDKIRDSLEISQTPSNFGQYFYTGKVLVQKDLLITKSALNTSNYSLAVECNDVSKCCPLGEKCSKAIEWDYEKITFKRDESIPIYTRCKPYFEELVCRVYFGKKPAQAKIKEINYTDEGGTISSIVQVTNIGFNELTLGKNSLKVLKKIGEEWEDTELTYPIKEINLIVQNQKHSFVWETKLLTGGLYKLEFKFEGTNAGYDINGFELVVGENQYCFIDENKIETQDYNTTHIRVIKFCNNCNYGYECLAQWIEKNDGNNYDVYETNSVQYIRKMYDGERCDRELGEETGYFSLQVNCIPGYLIIPVSNLNKGICCIKTPEAIPNPCETDPTSTECVIDWLPENLEYVCPTDLTIPAYNHNCNVNEWFRASGTINN